MEAKEKHHKRIICQHLRLVFLPYTHEICLMNNEIIVSPSALAQKQQTSHPNVAAWLKLGFGQLSEKDNGDAMVAASRILTASPLLRRRELEMQLRLLSLPFLSAFTHKFLEIAHPGKPPLKTQQKGEKMEH